MKRMIGMILTVVMVLSLTACAGNTASEKKTGLTQWKSDGVVTKITEYVEAVTDEKSSDFIPVKDRIAVFDLDGTLIGEQFPIYFEWLMFAQRVLDDPDFTPTDEMHDDVYYLDYQFDAGEEIIRDDVRIIKNVKSSKVVQMSQEIGQKPVLTFGNSSGDISMFYYVTSGNQYKSAAFCLVPDDDEREYAYPKKVESLTTKCNENGWNTISMKDDFLTIYGDDVVKQADNTPMIDRLITIYESKKK